MGKGEELKNITHLEVARYLKENGWQKIDDFGENGLVDVYRKDKTLIEIMVDDGLPSYSDLLRQALVSLAHVEGRRTSDVVMEIERFSDRRPNPTNNRMRSLK